MLQVYHNMKSLYYDMTSLHSATEGVKANNVAHHMQATPCTHAYHYSHVRI